MKAFVADQYGTAEVMHLGQLPEPKAAKGEVVVAVVASSVNPVDYKVRAGELRPISGRRFPRALGTEFSGTVAVLGPGVSGWSIGDAVYGMAVTALGRDGAHAERVAVPAEALRRKPSDLSFDLAATLPVAGLTALHGLRLCGDLKAKSLLINGATGGVGHFALQIAHHRGARVTAVCSAANAALATRWGASEVIDYRARDITKEKRHFDAIYDAHGHLGFANARKILSQQGIYVTPLGLPSVLAQSLWQSLRHRLGAGQQLLIGNVRSLPEDYAELEALIRAGAVQPHVSLTLPLTEAAAAFEACERGGLAGKAVIKVQQEAR
jgi:NADPH:quinone reductase-like Zn-dependent oxidoreductase